MKVTYRLALIPVLLLASLIFGMQLGSAQQDGQRSQKWEYKMIAMGHVHSESAEAWTATLNTEGEGGWEVIGTSFSARRGSTSECFAILKRPKN